MGRSLGDARTNNQINGLAFVALRTSAFALGAAISTLGCVAPLEPGQPTDEVSQVQQGLASGMYEVRSVNSNKCLDVTGQSVDNGAKVKQWDCNGQNNQRWNVTDLGGNQHRFNAVHSGKALDVNGGNMPAGALVQQWDYVGGGNQKWWIDAVPGGYTLKPTYNGGLCLDVFGGSTASGADIGVWNCNGGNNQKFTINPVSTGASWHTDWFDGFDGGWLDRGKWTVVVGQDGNFNGEAQWYVDEEGVENNFWVSNGELKIKLQREDRNFGYVKNYTSARLTTKGKFTPANGAWESRLVFWQGGGAGGVWPAFWLLGANVNEQPYAGGACWPTWSAREIDIFEYTMNGGALNPGNIITNFIQGTNCQQPWDGRGDVAVNVYAYHTYRMEFWGGEAKIFVDGQFKRSVNDDPWQDQGYAAILNVALGGGLGGPINWPGGAYAGITVDYVKHEAWW